jgi:hypothetical protein
MYSMHQMLEDLLERVLFVVINWRRQAIAGGLMDVVNGLGVVCGDAMRCAENNGRLSTLRSLDVMPRRWKTNGICFRR